MTKTKTRKLITALGGPTQLARDLSKKTGLSVKRPNVSMWGTLNTIPHKWRPHVARLAHIAGLAEKAITAEILAFTNSKRKVA